MTVSGGIINPDQVQFFTRISKPNEIKIETYAFIYMYIKMDTRVKMMQSIYAPEG